MNTCFYNIRLLSMDKNIEIIPGEVWVEGNRITYAGPSMRGDEPQEGCNMLLRSQYCW